LNQTPRVSANTWNRVPGFADPLPCAAAVQVLILPTKSGDFQVENAQIGMNRLAPNERP